MINMINNIVASLRKGGTVLQLVESQWTVMTSQSGCGLVFMLSVQCSENDLAYWHDCRISWVLVLNEQNIKLWTRACLLAGVSYQQWPFSNSRLLLILILYNIGSLGPKLNRRFYLSSIIQVVMRSWRTFWIQTPWTHTHIKQTTTSTIR